MPVSLLSLSKRPNVKITVTGFPVNCSLFFTRRAVFYDPYLWGCKAPGTPTENNFWVFEFQKVANDELDCFGILERHFEFLAGLSIPVSEIEHLQPRRISGFLGPDLTIYEERRKKFDELLVKIRKDDNYDPTLAFPT